MPHAGIEENQEGTSVNARQAEEEGTEAIGEDMREGREREHRKE